MSGPREEDGDYAREFFDGYEREADALVQRWERTPCVYCGMCHPNGTACPGLEFPGTEWDQ